MLTETKDYYAIMGLTRAATPAEVKKAYRKLARVHHPDVAKNKAAGEMMFKEINEAYEILGDPVHRRRYDDAPGNWRYGNPAAPKPRETYKPNTDSSRKKNPSSRINFEEQDAWVNGSRPGRSGYSYKYGAPSEDFTFDAGPQNQTQEKWFIQGRHGTEGPFDFVELAALLLGGDIDGSTPVRADGESDWRPFQERKEYKWARDLPAEIIHRHLNTKAMAFAESKTFTPRKIKCFVGLLGGCVAYLFYFLLVGSGTTITGGGLNYMAFKIFSHLLGGSH